MAYTNDRTERAKLHRLWIEVENRPCRSCGHDDLPREIHRKTPGYLEGKYTVRNCEVLCLNCHRGQHPNSKFRVGDRVFVNGRTPAYINLSRGTPRTVIAVEYNPIRECNYYTLGSNGRGESADGQPLDGIQFYKFRSYQLARYLPRKYGKRRYRMKPTDPRLTHKISPIKTPVNTSAH